MSGRFRVRDADADTRYFEIHTHDVVQRGMKSIGNVILKPNPESSNFNFKRLHAMHLACHSRSNVIL